MVPVEVAPVTRIPRQYVKAIDKAPSGVVAGQQVADVGEGEAVLFVIGMRINRLRNIRSWWGPFTGMPRMLKELEKHPEDGLLAAYPYWAGRNFLVLQYWRSAEDLGRYARATDRAHAPAWARFNKVSAGNGSVGVFHETYVVPRDAIESRYANMPPFGLAAAYGALNRGEARARTRAEQQVAVTDPDYVEA